MSIINNLIRKKTIFEKKDPKALCFFYDGKFDNELANLGIKLIGIKELSIYNWCDNIKSDNIKLITKDDIFKYSYDFIIFNSLIQHREYILKIPQSLHLPGIIINHEPNYETPYHLNKRIQESKLNIINTTYAEKNSQIKYGIQPNNHVEKDIEILLTGNFDPKDYGLLNHICREIPNVTIMGDCPNLPNSKKPKSYQEYRNNLAKCKIFVNLPTQKNISYDLLWAIADGALIISLLNPIDCQILNGTNSILCDSVPELIEQIKKCSKLSLSPSTTEGSKIQLAKSIVNEFSYENFVKQWNNIIKFYSQKVYIK